MKQTSDLRILSVTPLISPAILKSEFPITEICSTTVFESRKVVTDIIHGRDERMLAIVGPCSIHDPAAAREYASRLNELRKKISKQVYVIMRVYFEKPRTTVGWRGLIMDPGMDGSCDIAEGLRVARNLLLDITGMGLPVGSEVLDPIVPQYITDLVTWASIGARTTESQTHREMASGLSMPIGFKNGTDGTLQAAVNALTSAGEPHSFIGIDQQGATVVLKTTGNLDGHVILRGGKSGPNYYEESIEEAEGLLARAGFNSRLLIDCSHDNSGKKHVRQERVLYSILDQRRRGKNHIVGFMIESNLFEGNQKIPGDLSQLKYGVSVTDECIGWEKTEEMLLYAAEVLKEKAALRT